MTHVADRAGACAISLAGMIESAHLPWFAVRVREKFRTVTEGLFRAQEIEFYSPVITEIHQWSDRRKQVAVPLFAGYVFCRFDPRHSLPIVRTLGVIDIIRCGGRLAEVDAQELAAIAQALQGQSPVESLPHLVNGQRVRVIDGPMRDVEGVLLEYRSQVRLVLAVTMMNRSVAIQIDRSQVAAI